MSIKKQLHQLISLQQANIFHINDIVNSGSLDNITLDKAMDVKYYLEYEIQKLYKIIKENGLHVTIEDYYSSTTSEADSQSSFAKFSPIV